MSYRALIRKIRIKNFRSIVDETLELESFNVFVGLNDCGKSNVLKALNLFFNDETEPDQPLDFPRDYCQHGKTGKGKAKEIVIELYIEIPKDFKEAGLKIWKKVWRDNELFSDNLTDLFKPYSKCVTLFRRMRFEYVPAVKSNDYFQTLLLELYNSMTHSGDSSLLQANKVYSKSLSELTQNFSENIKQKLDIDSSIRMPDKLSVLFRNLKINTNDSNIKNIDLNHRGDGIKARHIPSILLSISNNIRESRKKNSIDYTFIWGYEEPENGVEFFSCSKLADELYGYSSNTQMIVTTHSPAIYTRKNNGNARCYYVYKNARGDSKYDENYSTVELNENIGLMPLIAPYIEEFQKVIDEREINLQLLQTEIDRLRAKTNKIIIYTEGKTDVKYLKLAFEKNDEYSEVYQRVEFYDIEHAAKTGDGELKKLYDYLQKGSDSNIKLCMFDRDQPSMIITNEYEEGDNRVFRFNIPTPPHRGAGDRISIEHYLTDENLSTIDADGKKIFLAKDFDDQGRSLDGLFIRQHAISSNDSKYNPLEILTGSEGQRVFGITPGDSKNYALNKDEFVTHIERQDPGFDFDLRRFKPILDVINRIVEYCDSKQEDA